MNTKEAIAAVIRTLETVEVKGRRNLDALLASIKVLESIKTDMERGEGDDAAD